MAERCIYTDDFLDLFYVASAGQDKMFVKVVEQVVEDTPTADVVKVKHAEWRSVVDDVIFACSNCDAEVSTSWDYENDDMFDYCPCCGAKMDGTPKERGGEK